ncbi:amino acid transporter [Ophiobolus disseminans]|uniref:Amino acid transporter n=1 Tax=Ophiobolus disseminans TaxID=1469910 RepID=A0A6A6ZGM1_9PLEO|nr:amino acid transporter [Ophiobolus disseminans]
MGETKNNSHSSDLERYPTTRAGTTQDLSHQLVGLHVQSETARAMSGLETISAGWVMCNSWAGIAATFALSIAQGGPVILIYGPIIMFVLVGSCALSLAELASVYPTAGGQYHWTSILAPKAWSRGLSYCCGATNVFAWIAICAGVAIIVPQLTVGLVISTNASYVPETWHVFLMYQAANLVVLVYNIYLLKRTMWIHDVGLVMSITSLLAILITSLARSSHDFQPAQAVWANFLNESGWVDSIAFLTGLVNPNYMYAGIDGAIHLAEECKNAAIIVPRALMSTIIIGFVTSFAFAIVSVYCTGDFEAVVSTPTGVPVYEIWRQGTRSDTAATVFLVFLLVMAFFALNGTHQTASRLTWSFARDNAMLGSRWLSQINPAQDVPIAALIFNFAIMFVIGCIYLGSSSAFNAFIGTGLVLQHITYAIPVIMLMYRKRSCQWLPQSRSFSLPSILGWTVNAITVLFAIFVLIFYCFPSARPVTGSSMNYASAVIGVMAMFAALNWFCHARKHYHGPRLHVAE